MARASDEADHGDVVVLRDLTGLALGDARQVEHHHASAVERDQQPIRLPGVTQVLVGLTAEKAPASPGMQARRDRLVAGLTDAGFGVLPSEGTYFVTADITPLGGVDGVAFCRALPQRCGVVAVPTQVFYDHQDAGRRFIRFAFCKREEVIDEAAARLRRLA